MALFIAVFSVSALAASDKRGTAEAKEDTMPPPIHAVCWIDEVNHVGGTIKNITSPSDYSPYDHLEEYYGYGFNGNTFTLIFYGKGLHDTNGLLCFAWCSANVPAER